VPTAIVRLQETLAVRKLAAGGTGRTIFRAVGYADQIAILSPEDLLAVIRGL